MTKRTHVQKRKIGKVEILFYKQALTMNKKSADIQRFFLFVN